MNSDLAIGEYVGSFSHRAQKHSGHTWNARAARILTPVFFMVCMEIGFSSLGNFGLVYSCVSYSDSSLVPFGLHQIFQGLQIGFPPNTCHSVVHIRNGKHRIPTMSCVPPSSRSSKSAKSPPNDNCKLTGNPRLCESTVR